jgi:hypothetical protein
MARVECRAQSNAKEWAKGWLPLKRGWPFTISIGGAAATAHTLEHGTSDNYTVENGQTASVRNTGTLNIEADFE